MKIRSTLSAALAALTVASSLCACSVHTNVSASSSAPEETVALYERLCGEAPDENVILAYGEDAAKYADLSALRDEGYMIRRESGKTAILAVTEDGLDRAVRYYANHVPPTGDISYTYGEGCKVGQITIAGVDISEFSIYLWEGADELHTTAATELQSHIEKACGVTVPIVNEKTAHSFSFDRVMTDDPRYADYGDEGWSIEVKDGSVIITCGELRGALYGVYGFLCDYLGWSFICDWETYHGNSADLDLDFTETLADADAIDIPEGASTELVSPAIPVRFVFRGGSHLFDMRVGDNYQIRAEKSAGGSFNGYRINNVASHGINQMFKEYSISGQPCYSDPEFIEEAIEFYIEKVESMLESGFTVGYDLIDVDVAQKDTTDFCKCKRCRDIIHAEDSATGPIMRFTNAMADALGGEDGAFPGLYVDMLAYAGTTKPTVTDPRPNVSVAYCFFMDVNKSVCYAHSLDGTQCSGTYYRTTGSPYYVISNIDYAAELREWCERSTRVAVWYYPGIWNMCILPSSIMDQLVADMRFFIDLDIYALYLCPSGCSYKRGGYNQTEEMIASYLIEQLCWHPDMTDEDIAAYLAEYLEILCGDGYENMVLYYDILKRETVSSCWSSMFSWPSERVSLPYIRKMFNTVYDLFDDARDRATTKAQEQFVDRLSRTALVAGLISTQDEWYFNGTEEQRARYIEIFERFRDIHSRLPMPIKGYQETVTLPDAANLDINVNLATYMHGAVNAPREWWKQ